MSSMPLSAALIPLTDRAVIAVGGEDRVSFLQGLVTNDVTQAAPDRALWSALLTAQGKFLHEFFIIADGEHLLLECESARREDLLRRLRMFKLRAKVNLADLSDRLAVFARLDGESDAVPGRLWREDGDGIAYTDPRHAGLGTRLILPAGRVADATGDKAAWEQRRLALGLPDGSRDMLVEKSILLENGFDELHAIAWTKGCYVGQELTARTKYRGLVKKRLVPVRLAGSLPAPGTPVMAAEREVGEIRSGAGDLALALIRLDALNGPDPLQAGETQVHPTPPDWLVLPQTEGSAPTNG